MKPKLLPVAAAFHLAGLCAPFHFFFEALCSIFACPLSGCVPDFLALALIGLCADSSLPLAFVIGM